MAKSFRAPGAPESISWHMNLPYAMTWLGAKGGFRKAATVREPTHSMLYFYALKKPFQFQSDRWLASIAQRTDGSAAHAMPTGHWIMLQAKDEVNAKLKAWFGAAQLPS
jgi:cis-3-alkyl-4-acyloxetan-2-one decarboxylase